jgi:hypothetical protein
MGGRLKVRAGAEGPRSAADGGLGLWGVLSASTPRCLMWPSSASCSAYRSKRWVAVQLQLVIPAGAAPFTLGGAKLEAKGQGELAVVGVWSPGPLVPGVVGSHGGYAGAL